MIISLSMKKWSSAGTSLLNLRINERLIYSSSKSYDSYVNFKSIKKQIAVAANLDGFDIQQISQHFAQQPLLVLVHNIDGCNLRNMHTQSVLAALASDRNIMMVHMTECIQRILIPSS